jgi:hypothetical protein
VTPRPNPPCPLAHAGCTSVTSVRWGALIWLWIIQNSFSFIGLSKLLHLQSYSMYMYIMIHNILIYILYILYTDLYSYRRYHSLDVLVPTERDHVSFRRKTPASLCKTVESTPIRAKPSGGHHCNGWFLYLWHIPQTCHHGSWIIVVTFHVVHQPMRLGNSTSSSIPIWWLPKIWVSQTHPFIAGFSMK